MELSFAEDVYQQCRTGGLGGIGGVGPEVTAELDVALDEAFPGMGINVPELPVPMSDSECQELADCLTGAGVTEDVMRQKIREAPALGAAYRAVVGLVGPCYPPRWSRYLIDITDLFNWVVYGLQTFESKQVPEGLAQERGSEFSALSEAEQKTKIEMWNELDDAIKTVRDEVRDGLIPQLHWFEPRVEQAIENGTVFEFEFEYCEARLYALTRIQEMLDLAQELYEQSVQYTDYFRALRYALDSHRLLEHYQSVHTRLSDKTPPCADDFTLLDN